MTLKDILDVYGAGCYLHIGTECGNGYCWTGKTIQADEALQDWYERKVINIYNHEGRERNSSCCELKPGIVVIVEGYEQGFH